LFHIVSTTFKLSIMVFFAAKKHVELPSKDLLSWIFDDIRYDPDKPVPTYALQLQRICLACSDVRCRSSSMLSIRLVQSPPTKPELWSES